MIGCSMQRPAAISSGPSDSMAVRLLQALAGQHAWSSPCRINSTLTMLLQGQHWDPHGFSVHLSYQHFTSCTSILQQQRQTPVDSVLSTGHQGTWHQQQCAAPTIKATKQSSGVSLQLPNNPLASGRRGPDIPRIVLYRGPGLFLFRFFVRTKVFQLAGVFAAVLMLSTTMGTTPEQHSPDVLVAAAAVLVGCVVTSYCLWYYSSRYVGELSLLLPERRVLRFSVLDFWGNRQDVDVPVEHVQPPFRNCSIAQVKALTSRTLMPLTVVGDRDYYISVPHGKLLDKEVLQKICYGSWLQELDTASTQQSAGEEKG